MNFPRKEVSEKTVADTPGTFYIATGRKRHATEKLRKKSDCASCDWKRIVPADIRWFTHKVLRGASNSEEVDDQGGGQELPHEENHSEHHVPGVPQLVFQVRLRDRGRRRGHQAEGRGENSEVCTETKSNPPACVLQPANPNGPDRGWGVISVTRERELSSSKEDNSRAETARL